MGFPHPDLFLEKLSASQLNETLAYLYIESGNFDKKHNSAKNLKNSLSHLVSKKEK